MELKLIYEIAGILILAGLIAALANLLKQPAIIAYIATGLVIGPIGYFQLHNKEVLDALGQIGIALLLFMVGLELDVKKIKQHGKTSVIAGLSQIIITGLLGFALCLFLGFSKMEALYLAIAFAFASTIIIVKLLAEKKDQQSLYGRLTIGVLIVQDFVALGILIFLTAAYGNSSGYFSSLPSWQYFLSVFTKCLIIFLFLKFLSKKVFPKFVNQFGKSDEMLLIFSLAWALGFASFMSLKEVGFSFEVGGFLAGLALANSVVHYEIASKIKALRDFFIIIFFIVFGSKLALVSISSMIFPAIILSLFVIIGNPILLYVILSKLGYGRRTAFFSSLAMAQVSEFSFVLALLGFNLGHISDKILGLITLVGIISIAISSYLIKNANAIFIFADPILKKFKLGNGQKDKSEQLKILENHIVLIGTHRLGGHLLHSLSSLNKAFLIIDFDPEICEKYSNLGYNVICGDITDEYIQEQANLSKAQLVISTVPDLKDNLILLESINRNISRGEKKPKLIFMAQNKEETLHLYNQEIDYVISPHFISGLHLAKLLENDLDFNTLKTLRLRHLNIVNNQ